MICCMQLNLDSATCLDLNRLVQDVADFLENVVECLE